MLSIPLTLGEGRGCLIYSKEATERHLIFHLPASCLGHFEVLAGLLCAPSRRIPCFGF